MLEIVQCMYFCFNTEADYLSDLSIEFWSNICCKNFVLRLLLCDISRLETIVAMICSSFVTMDPVFFICVAVNPVGSVNVQLLPNY